MAAHGEVAPGTGFIAAELTMMLPLSPAVAGGSALIGASASLDAMLLKCVLQLQLFAAHNRRHCFYSTTSSPNSGCRYNAELGGVLVAYSRLRPATAAATATPAEGGGAYLRSTDAMPLCRIYDDQPVMHARVSMDAMIFAPRLGDLLSATVSSVGSDHIGALVGAFVAASIGVCPPPPPPPPPPPQHTHTHTNTLNTAGGLFNASVLTGDMAAGYTFDGDSSGGVWRGGDAHERAAAQAAAAAAAGSKRRRAGSIATLLAANPDVIATGSTIHFRVIGLSHSMGLLAIHGSFVDAAGAAAAAAVAATTAAAAATTAAAATPAAAPPAKRPAVEAAPPSAAKPPKKDASERKPRKASTASS